MATNKKYVAKKKTNVSTKRTNTATKNNKKKKKNSINLFVILDILLIIVIIIFLSNIVFNYNTNNESKDNHENNTNNNNSNNNNNTQNNNKELNTKQEKLNYLGNINKGLDFFKMDYLDRYVDYKKNNPNLDNEKVIVYVNIGLDKEFYTDIKDSPYKHTNTVISNKYYNLGSSYEPYDLTAIDSNYSSGKRYMTKEAAKAFEEMAKDAKKKGYTIRAMSTYRSYSYQTTLYNNYAEKDGRKKADTYSARAGHSEHQTGLAVDVDNTKVTYTQFGSTKEFIWMKENCYKYGFILRYTKETEFITGYVNEPWHYRYVGKEIAKYIHDHPMTYEEYFVRFLDK